MTRTQNKVSFAKMRSAVFFGLIIIFALAVIYIFSPLLYPIFWAAIIAVMFYPIYKKLLRFFKSKNLTASIVLVLVIVTILLPLVLLSILIVNESINLYSSVNEKGIFTTNTVEGVSNWLEKTPLQPYLETVKKDWITYGTGAIKKLSEVLFNSAKSITQNSLKFIFLLFIMFYTLFFFLRDGDKILKRLMMLSPLGEKYEKMLFDKFTSTTRATLKSTLIVGGIQGTLGGLLFLATGIEGAFIWGIIMVALSIIPAFGPFIIWMPAAIIMLAFGNLWQGILIILFGFIVIGTIDNILRPPLVGRDIQMHPLIVLFATIGGLIIFGISGFVIGPIIAALFTSIMSIYEHYYKNELKSN